MVQNQWNKGGASTPAAILMDTVLYFSHSYTAWNTYITTTKERIKSQMTSLVLLHFTSTYVWSLYTQMQSPIFLTPVCLLMGITHKNKVFLFIRKFFWMHVHASGVGALRAEAHPPSPVPLPLGFTWSIC